MPSGYSGLDRAPILVQLSGKLPICRAQDNQPCTRIIQKAKTKFEPALQLLFREYWVLGLHEQLRWEYQASYLRGESLHFVHWFRP